MAANVRDGFDSGGIVAIRERPESAQTGSARFCGGLPRSAESRHTLGNGD